MTLTKAKLLETAQSRTELVKDVGEYGDVWIRSCPRVQRSRRMATYADQEEAARYEIHLIVDQVMESEMCRCFRMTTLRHLTNLTLRNWNH